MPSCTSAATTSRAWTTNRRSWPWTVNCRRAPGRLRRRAARRSSSASSRSRPAGRRSSVPRARRCLGARDGPAQALGVDGLEQVVDRVRVEGAERVLVVGRRKDDGRARGRAAAGRARRSRPARASGRRGTTRSYGLGAPSARAASTPSVASSGGARRPASTSGSSRPAQAAAGGGLVVDDEGAEGRGRGWRRGGAGWRNGRACRCRCAGRRRAARSRRRAAAGASATFWRPTPKDAVAGRPSARRRCPGCRRRSETSTTTSGPRLGAHTVDVPPPRFRSMPCLTAFSTSVWTANAGTDSLRDVVGHARCRRAACRRSAPARRRGSGAPAGARRAAATDGLAAGGQHVAEQAGQALDRRLGLARGCSPMSAATVLSALNKKCGLIWARSAASSASAVCRTSVALALEQRQPLDGERELGAERRAAASTSSVV